MVKTATRRRRQAGGVHDDISHDEPSIPMKSTGQSMVWRTNTTATSIGSGFWILPETVEMRLAVFRDSAQAAAVLVEPFQGHFLDKSHPPGSTNERAGVLVEPFAAQAGLENLILIDLDGLGQVTEGAIVLITGKRRLFLGQDRKSVV